MEATNANFSIQLDQLPGGEAIQRSRKEALALFNQKGLPDLKNEEYRHTPLSRTLEKVMDFSRPGVKGNVSEVKPYLIDGLDASIAVFINGEFSKTHSSIDSDLEVISMESAIDADLPGLQTSFQTDAFTAWNTAAWSSGVMIRVPDQVVVRKPLLLLYIYDTRQGASFSFIRNLIRTGKNSQVEIIEKVEAVGEGLFFSNVVNEGVAEENSRLSWTSIQNSSGHHLHYGHTVIQQLNSSHVECNTYSLNGEFIRNNLSLTIDGRNCEGHMYGLYLLKGKTFVDNHTVMDHRKADSFSNEMYRGVLGDQSRAVFNGKIFVRPNAQKTNAFQANRNILLTDQAVVHTKPQLEIWADDVKCSHGCTTGQLDNEALFYLRSRGIPESEARGMLLYAFVYETFGHLRNEALKKYITELVGQRLHKES